MNSLFKKSIILMGLIFSIEVFSACFENDQVKLLDIIELENSNTPKSTGEKTSKLSADKKELVKETKLFNFSMGGPKEDIKINYYKNSYDEDVASYDYSGKRFYRVRNLKNGCTALFTSDPVSKKVLLIASLPADSKDGFFQNGVATTNYLDAHLEGVSAVSTQNQFTESETNNCRVVNDGVSIYSIVSSSCGRIKFCKMEAICKGSNEIVKAFCKAIDDDCPSFKDCDQDESFQKLSQDFVMESKRKEVRSKASGQ